MFKVNLWDFLTTSGVIEQRFEKQFPVLPAFIINYHVDMDKKMFIRADQSIHWQKFNEQQFR